MVVLHLSVHGSIECPGVVRIHWPQQPTASACRHLMVDRQSVVRHANLDWTNSCQAGRCRRLRNLCRTGLMMIKHRHLGRWEGTQCSIHIFVMLGND